MQLLHKIFFRLRKVCDIRPPLRKGWLTLQGASVGPGTRLPNLEVSWPHQVKIGRDCTLEGDTLFKFDGIWRPGPSIIIEDGVFLGRACEFNIRKRIVIGKNSLIASGCKFIDHDHGVLPGELMARQTGPEAEIILEDDVWLGVNVVVLKGVRIQSGAVVAAGAVVTKSIGPGEIWGGIPAKKLRDRPAAAGA